MYKVDAAVSGDLGTGVQAKNRQAFIDRFGGTAGGNTTYMAWIRLITDDPAPILAAYAAGEMNLQQRPFVTELPAWVSTEEAFVIDRETPAEWPETKAEGEAVCRRSVRHGGGAGASNAVATQDGWLFLAENVHHTHGVWNLWVIETHRAIQILQNAGQTMAATRVRLFAAGYLSQLYVYNMLSPQTVLIKLLREAGETPVG